MKKLMVVLAALVALSLVLVACGNNYNNGDYQLGYEVDPDRYPTDPDLDYDFDLDGGFGGGEWVDPDGNPDPELIALVNVLLEGIDDVPMPLEMELTEENFQRFVFIDYIEGSTGVVSQAAISAIPHAVVLIELPEGVDAAAVAAEIDAAADPAHWICVEAEKASVFYGGNYVVFVMSFESVVNGIEANLDAAFGCC